jgi:Pvc16 N-terminal domain
MSDFTAISAVSLTLKALLGANITTPATLDISLQSPKEMHQAGTESGVSVWLYKVSRMAEMLNEPPQRRHPDQELVRPLPVLLYYLITPMTKDPATSQTVLGQVLQIFNDHAILRGAALQGSLSGTTEQLRISLEALTIEELSQIWYALHEPYQLSVTYLVQLVNIDSGRQPIHSPPALRKITRYEQILSVN